MIKQSRILWFNNVPVLYTNADNKKLIELKEEKESLEYDLGSIGPAIKAASKISNGEIPTEEEDECLSELKDNYPAFFDSEGEEEGSSSLLNKIMGVKRYISKEISTNTKSLNLFKDKNKESSLESKKSLIENEDSVKEFIIEKGESSKRKANKISEDSESESESESSKKIKSISDVIDDSTYNPFDDIGTD